MIRVLHVTNNLHNGGIEKFVLSINKELKEKVTFDYVILTSTNNFDKYIKYINQYGGRIYDEFPKKWLNKKFKNLRLFFFMKKILLANRYHAIHIHDCMGIFPVLLAAFWCRVPVRIVHSHQAFPREQGFHTLPLKSKILMKINSISCNLFATHLFGPSMDACVRLFGDLSRADKRIKIIYNGIDLNMFSPISKPITRGERKLCFCNIGRYTKQKNQLFLLDVFFHLNKKLPCHLNLVGFGELETEIRKKIKKMSLEKDVTLLPHDSFIPDVLRGTDYFIFPSLYEGLGITLIEAQAMGIQCFISDSIPLEAQLGLCEVIPLNLGSEEWANYIVNSIENGPILKLNHDKLMNYDIKRVSLNLLKDYLVE